MMRYRVDGRRDDGFVGAGLAQSCGAVALLSGDSADASTDLGIRQSTHGDRTFPRVRLPSAVRERVKSLRTMCGPGGFCNVPGPGIALNEIGVADAPNEAVETVSVALAAVATRLMHGPERFGPLFSEGYTGAESSTCVWGLAS